MSDTLQFVVTDPTLNLTETAQLMSDMLQRLLRNATSHSPQALAWGHSGRLNFGNRFNGFRLCAEIFHIFR
jgi:hypothetical protein